MRYHNITHEDMLNGDGIRVVLWVAGCDHHCPECQNPETWRLDGGVPFDNEALNEICIELNKDYVSGITFSGGDPLQPKNVDTVVEILKWVRNNFPEKTIWLYTGYTFEDLINKDDSRCLAVSLCDVLVDGEYKKDLRDINLKWRGSSNQRVIDVQKSLRDGKVVLHCD